MENQKKTKGISNTNPIGNNWKNESKLGNKLCLINIQTGKLVFNNFHKEKEVFRNVKSIEAAQKIVNKRNLSCMGADWYDRKGISHAVKNNYL